MGKDDDKKKRLAEALRTNLRRRKAQARGEGSADPAVGKRHCDGDSDEQAD